MSSQLARLDRPPRNGPAAAAATPPIARTPTARARRVGSSSWARRTRAIDAGIVTAPILVIVWRRDHEIGWQ